MTFSAPLLVILLAAAPASAAPPVELKAAPQKSVQPVVDSRADLVVRAVGQKELPARFNARERAAASRVANQLRAGQVEEAKSTWNELVKSGTVGAGADADAIVLWVIRQAYLEQNQDLRHYADKVRFFNQAKRSIGTHLSEAKALKAREARVVALRPVQLRPYATDAQPIRPAATRQMSKAELEDYISVLEKKLNTVGDDAQLANVDLQNVLQKQQQMLQMISNIAKILHESRSSNIRKIGG